MALAPVAPAAAPGAAAVPESAPRQGFGAVLRAEGARVRAGPQPAPRSPALETLKGIEAAQRRLDAVLEAARGGRTFTARELLSLQAAAYRSAQTVDLAARVVEHGAQTVKQAVNTQV